MTILLQFASAWPSAAQDSPQKNAELFREWKHSGIVFVLTTPEGADLPATAVVENFPLLVRLDKDWFNFSQAKSRGEDIRFSAGTGQPLAYQIEEWDAERGTASVWVRVPVIKGSERQPITLHWGQPNAVSESNGKAVFNADNGFVSVLHLDAALSDELGALSPKNQGTTAASGLIGQGRHFTPGKGIHGGDHIATYPFSDNAFTSEAWFRPAGTDSTIFYWGRYATRLNGKTGDGNEVSLNIGSPASLNWASDGPGGAHADAAPLLGQWNHVAATYENGTSRIFVNGKLAGSRFHKSAMSIVQDIVVNVGGMRGSNYRYVGDVDEVRVSKVARSADWLRLQFENQKPTQTLVGPIVQPGDEFSVSHTELVLSEGQSGTITAKAGGAQKLYWILKHEGLGFNSATDRHSFTFNSGRITGDNDAMSLTFKAIYANEVKTIDIPITIKEAIPEPVFTLTAPATWDGRQTIEVVPQITNLAAMQAKGASDMKTAWTVSGGAVIREARQDKLILKRSQFIGTIVVKAAVNNGGADSIETASIVVTEPKHDAWVQRTPAKDEQPEDNQFFARDDKNEGTLFYNGVLDQAADGVFLKLYADDKLLKTETQKLGADKSFALTTKLKPGLIKYRVDFGSQTGGAETVLRTVKNLVCGDAYIIQGQSNAEATGPNNGPTIDVETPSSEWIRSYGNSYSGETKGGWSNAIRTRIWGKPDYGHAQIGAWGMVLATDLVQKHRIPICIMNGAVGGTRIDQHQRNEADPRDSSTIYGRLLRRIEAARLTHGIRGVLWHQGENNQGSASPTGDYDWKSYQQYFVDLSAAWKQDYPNIQNYYIHQVWPSGCNMGGTHAGDMLLDVQRTLPSLYSNMRIMSMLGIVSGSSGRGLCYFDLEGYALIAKQIRPLVEQDHYGLDHSTILTAPNLRRASFTNDTRTGISLEFDQPMTWKDECKAWIELNGAAAPIASGKASGNSITLQLTAPTEAKKIAYLSGKHWDGRADKLLYGTNGIAALTFCDVLIESPKVVP